jgi:hypothetical protein
VSDTETEVAIGWVYHDGGRHAAGFRGKTGDCVTRAIAIATGQSYGEVYNTLFDRQIDYLDSARKTKKHLKRMEKSASPRDGVWPEVYKPYLAELGWEWHPIMKVGSGTTVHLAYDEIPDEPVMIVRLSAHLSAVMQGIVYDTFDPSRDGSRALYGYWTPPTS